VLLAFAASTASAAPVRRACPLLHGSLSYVRDGKAYTLSLANCTERAGGRLVTRFPPVHGIRTTGATPGVQRLYVHGRLVVTHWETGPLVAVGLSPDGRFVVFFVDEYGGESSIADGTPFYVVSTRGGPVHDLGRTLPYPDSVTWCAGELVWTPGADRVAIDGKRLLAAAPPAFVPRALWSDAQRTFGQPACEPHRAAVAVLTQHSSKVANFFATRWRLWRVGLDGSRHAIDVPPPGWADEQPTWSPDGGSIAFVRERNGYGRLMIRRNGRLHGPVAQLGYALGYYGHHDWGLAWRR
jgi:hypothetical protein